MTPSEPKACTACARHMRFDGHHVCTLGPECFDLNTLPHPPVLVEGEWVGVVADDARRMGQQCGPAGALWEPRQA